MRDRRVCSHMPSSSFIITLSCRRHPCEPHLVITASCSSLHRYLIYDNFLHNLIKCLWISESNNLWLWSVCVFTYYWCWWLWIESVLWPVVFFFFFWLFGFVTLCHSVFVTLSLSYYIDKRDRERLEFLEITQIREYLFDYLFVLCWLVVGHNRDKWQKKKKLS